VRPDGREGFPGYYLMTADLVTWAKSQGILVGPGRGSGAASRMAYLHRITEVDPIGADLLLDRFMTKGRKSLPDFDLDFPTSKSDVMTHYARDRYGERARRAGRHSHAGEEQERVQGRISSHPVAAARRQLHPPRADQQDHRRGGEFYSRAGLSWEDLFAQVGDLLEPYREKIPEVFELAEVLPRSVEELWSSRGRDHHRPRQQSPRRAAYAAR